MISKKSQGAVEFLIILVFMMVVLSFIMYYLGLYSIDAQKQENQLYLDDFAKSIENEVDIVQSAQTGYERQVIIPKYFMERYNLTITSNYLILQDLEHDGDTGSKSYYYLPGIFDVNYTYNNISGESYILFKKVDLNTTTSTSGITLE